ncbi:MAG: HPr family phosphocarrier protein [Lachnospiraceae bacterium]
MNEKQIRLQSRQEVQDFVQAAVKCNFDIDISYDRVVIDAKSFLGVLGLGVSRVLTVKYCGMNNEFENTVQKYVVA